MDLFDPEPFWVIIPVAILKAITKKERIELYLSYHSRGIVIISYDTKLRRYILNEKGVLKRL